MTHQRIDDEQWGRVTPLLMVGNQNESQDRPDLREAVDALLWQDRQPDGAETMPNWVTDRALTQAYLRRWTADGLATQIRRAVSQRCPAATDNAKEPSEEAPREAAPADNAKESKPPEEAPRGAARPLPRAPWHTTAAGEPPRQHLRPVEPEPDAPRVRDDMIRDLQKWVMHHYFQGHISGDWEAGDLGRHYLPAFECVLELMVIHWEVENDRRWPEPLAFEAMPTDNWMDRVEHARAIALAVGRLEDSINQTQRAAEDVKEVALRGTPYRFADRDKRDRLIRVAADDVSRAGPALAAAANTLRTLAVTQAREANRAAPSAQSATPKVDDPRQASAEPPPRKARRQAQRRPLKQGEETYEQRAVRWAGEHGGRSNHPTWRRA